MDFASWSPSHTILAAFALLAFVGQVAVLFYRTGSLEKRMDKQNDAMHKQSETLIHAIERLEDKMDKRFTDVKAEIIEVRSEMNQRLSDVAAEISKLNQNHIDHLTRHSAGYQDTPDSEKTA
ncbi:MAG: hypothetical protein OXN17_21320 [Candidatus Poribacteria bacterium]|nr:hypothetical protein [Candidatus Poribacteria bacterium]